MDQAHYSKRSSKTNSLDYEMQTDSGLRIQQMGEWKKLSKIVINTPSDNNQMYIPQHVPIDVTVGWDHSHGLRDTVLDIH